jgi:hypothetical protein
MVVKHTKLQMWKGAPERRGSQSNDLRAVCAVAPSGCYQGSPSTSSASNSDVSSTALYRVEGTGTVQGDYLRIYSVFHIECPNFKTLYLCNHEPQMNETYTTWTAVA